LRAPDAAHYEAVIDGLAIPTDWELARTIVKAPGGLDDCAPIFPGCPSVARYYLVPGKPVGTYPVAKQILTGAGFEIEQESGLIATATWRRGVPPSEPDRCNPRVATEPDDDRRIWGSRSRVSPSFGSRRRGSDEQLEGRCVRSHGLRTDHPMRRTAP
jgi:hypothetical protein